MTFFSLALVFFLLMDSFGNIPLYLSILKSYPLKRQHYIVAREMSIAIIIMLVFQFLGERALIALKVSQSAIHIAGAVILFLIALKMIFSSNEEEETEGVKKQKQEPLIVPLAVPFVAGPAVLAAVIVFGHKEKNHLFVSLALITAWALTGIILFFSTYLEKILGKRVLLALEKLMGLVLTLLAVQMCMDGIALFIKGLDK